MKIHILLTLIVTATLTFNSQLANAAEKTTPVFLHDFIADGDTLQCGNQGTTKASLGEWTEFVTIDTDNRSGGCRQKFSIYDPDSVLKGLKIYINFYPDDEPRQCGQPGKRDIPISVDLQTPNWSDPMRIDTDDRRGGCVQEYTIEGRGDVALYIQYEGDHDATQCNAFGHGLMKITRGNPAKIRIDTDSRTGGCKIRYKLSKEEKHKKPA